MSNPEATESADRKVVWLGPYLTEYGEMPSEALVMTDESYRKIVQHNALALKARNLILAAWHGEMSLSQLAEQLSDPSLEKTLAPVLYGGVRELISEHNPVTASEVRQCLDDVLESEDWPDVFAVLDDADIVLAGLPDSVADMGESGTPSVMTDYHSITWRIADLPLIRELLEADGWVVRDTEFRPSWP